ncbi:hypothetical protein [Streptomyces longispororuber]|uniref:hypothetical protein n=1 Tax=Streptomyces longispororuber TaxID=68230 RepID=UPI0036F4C475
MGAFFYVQAYDTADHAAARFGGVSADKEENTDGHDPTQVEPLGDERVAYRKNIVNGAGTEVGVRDGTAVTWTTYRSCDSGPRGPDCPGPDARRARTTGPGWPRTSARAES